MPNFVKIDIDQTVAKMWLFSKFHDDVLRPTWIFKNSTILLYQVSWQFVKLLPRYID